MTSCYLVVYDRVYLKYDHEVVTSPEALVSTKFHAITSQRKVLDIVTTMNASVPTFTFII
jgi:hypothetical protein